MVTSGDNQLLTHTNTITFADTDSNKMCLCWFNKGKISIESAFLTVREKSGLIQLLLGNLGAV